MLVEFEQNPMVQKTTPNLELFDKNKTKQNKTKQNKTKQNKQTKNKNKNKNKNKTKQTNGFFKTIFQRFDAISGRRFCS